MRRVTAKPPNMLTAVSAMLTAARPWISASGRETPSASGGAICTSAPMQMIDEIALVTLISGVCRAGVTFQTTM